MATQLRLDKLLSDTGRWSRKEAKLLLKQGRVRVDAQVERAAERKVDPASQRVEVDGAQVIWAKFRYLMLNKPGGVLTATEDRRQKTVLDLLPEEYRSLSLSGGWTRTPRDFCCSPTTESWPTACSPPGTMWTRSIWPRSTDRWITLTLRPLKPG